MLRIAIQGNLPEGSNLVEHIIKNSGCILSGFHADLNDGLSDIDHFIDHTVPLFDNFIELLQNSDAIIFLNHGLKDILSVKQALRKSKHVFIHPKDLLSPVLLNEYQNLADEAGVLFYIFHKPIIGELENLIRNLKDSPEFIDITRKVRETDGKIPDLKKLILKEILYLSSINQQAIRKFKTISVPYNSENPFLVNLRIDFVNYSSANLTINSLSGEDSRNTEVYFRRHTLHLNTLERNIKVVPRDKSLANSHPLYNITLDESDPSLDIDQFIHKLNTYAYPANSFDSGINAYLNSWEILDKIIPAVLEK